MKKLIIPIVLMIVLASCANTKKSTTTNVSHRDTTSVAKVDTGSVHQAGTGAIKKEEGQAGSSLVIEFSNDFGFTSDSNPQFKGMGFQRMDIVAKADSNPPGQMDPKWWMNYVDGRVHMSDSAGYLIIKEPVSNVIHVHKPTEPSNAYVTIGDVKIPTQGVKRITLNNWESSKKSDSSGSSSKDSSYGHGTDSLHGNNSQTNSTANSTRDVAAPLRNGALLVWGIIILIILVAIGYLYYRWRSASSNIKNKIL
jgi:hypothetical protein